MSSLFKNLVIAICITGVFGLVYYFFTRDSDKPALAEPTLSDSEVTRRTNKIIADINKMNEYKMDVTILEDKRFSTLYDFGISITDVSAGRNNPFAPVE